MKMAKLTCLNQFWKECDAQTERSIANFNDGAPSPFLNGCDVVDRFCSTPLLNFPGRSFPANLPLHVLRNQPSMPNKRIDYHWISKGRRDDHQSL